MKFMYSSIKYSYSDILFKNINFIYNRLFCCNHTCSCACIVSVAPASGYVTSTSRYQSRSSMYIWGLITQNWTRQFPLKPRYKHKTYKRISVDNSVLLTVLHLILTRLFIKNKFILYSLFLKPYIDDLARGIISYEIYLATFGDFNKFNMKWFCVRFCLSYDFLLDINSFKFCLFQWNVVCAHTCGKDIHSMVDESII